MKRSNWIAGISRSPIIWPYIFSIAGADTIFAMKTEDSDLVPKGALVMFTGREAPTGWRALSESECSQFSGKLVTNLVDINHSHQVET